MFHRVAVLVFFLLSAAAIAAPRESIFAEFAAKELRAVSQSAKKVEFKGSADINISSYYFLTPKAERAIVISPGWSEPALLYLEFIYDLKAEGYDVYIIDHRGQGESARFFECQCSHLDQYNYYVDDLVSFVEIQVLPKKYKKVFLLGHSMGGAIASLAAKKLSTKIDKLILTAPLFQLNTGSLPEWFSRIVVRSLVGLGYGESRRPFDADRVPSFLTNRWTQSEVRWNFAKQTGDSLKAAKIRYVTNGWLNEVFKMTDEVQSLKENLFTQPTLILQAESDAFVMSEKQNEICSLSQQCRIVPIKGSRHSVLLDKDDVREKSVQTILEFIKN